MAAVRAVQQPRGELPGPAARHNARDNAIVERLPIPARAAGPRAMPRDLVIAGRLARRHNLEAFAELNRQVARLYQLTVEEFRYVLSTFPLVESDVRRPALALFVASDPPRLASSGGQGPAGSDAFRYSRRWNTSAAKPRAISSSSTRRSASKNVQSRARRSRRSRRRRARPASPAARRSRRAAATSAAALRRWPASAAGRRRGTRELAMHAGAQHERRSSVRAGHRVPRMNIIAGDDEQHARPSAP